MASLGWKGLTYSIIVLYNIFFNFLIIKDETSEIMYNCPCACHESIGRCGGTAPHL
jgi:hypothetical protein